MLKILTPDKVVSVLTSLLSTFTSVGIGVTEVISPFTSGVGSGACVGEGIGVLVGLGIGVFVGIEVGRGVEVGVTSIV